MSRIKTTLDNKYIQRIAIHLPGGTSKELSAIASRLYGLTLSHSELDHILVEYEKKGLLFAKQTSKGPSYYVAYKVSPHDVRPLPKLSKSLTMILETIESNPGTDRIMISHETKLASSTVRNGLTQLFCGEYVVRAHTQNSNTLAYWLRPMGMNWDTQQFRALLSTSVTPAPEVKPAPAPAPENCAPPAPAPKITPTPEPTPPPSKEQKSQLSLFNIGAESESFSAQKEALKHLADAAKLNNSYAIQALKEIALGKA